MNYIFDDPSKDPIYPLSLPKFKELYPNVMLPSDITLAELAAENMFWVFPVTVESLPSFDPNTHRLAALPPVKIDQEYIQSWEVSELTPEEIPVPAPDWTGFQLAALTTPEFNAMVATANPTEPLACASLASLFTQIAMGGPTEPLVVAFSKVVQAGSPSEADLLKFIGAAQYFHIPEPLIDVLLRQWLPETP